MNENHRKAVEAFFHEKKKTKSLRKIAKEYGISPSTVYARINKTKTRAEANDVRQVLSKYQEQFLEGYLVFLAKRRLP